MGPQAAPLPGEQPGIERLQRDPDGFRHAGMAGPQGPALKGAEIVRRGDQIEENLGERPCRAGAGVGIIRHAGFSFSPFDSKQIKG